MAADLRAWDRRIARLILIKEMRIGEEEVFETVNIETVFTHWTYELIYFLWAILLLTKLAGVLSEANSDLF